MIEMFSTDLWTKSQIMNLKITNFVLVSSIELDIMYFSSFVIIDYNDVITTLTDLQFSQNEMYLNRSILVCTLYMYASFFSVHRPFPMLARLIRHCKEVHVKTATKHYQPQSLSR